MTLDPTSAPYNPINGRELLDVILRRAYSQLRDHQDFSEAITYPAFTFTLTIDLQVPHEERHLISESKGSQGTLDKSTKKTLTLSGKGAAAPDQDRTEAGLHIPRPTLTTGGIVDIPTIP